MLLLKTLLILSAHSVLLTLSAPGQVPMDTVVTEEGGSAVLPCSHSANIEKMVFDWKKKPQEVFFYGSGQHYSNGMSGQDSRFRGRVFHFPEELKHGNASIIIRNAEVADSGNYTCYFPELGLLKSYLTLVVHRVPKDRSAENIVGASPKPDIRMLNATKKGVRLLCEIQGAFPLPDVVWQDSHGNLLPAEEPRVARAGDRYNVSLLTTVTKTTPNCFVCVATQRGIHHKIENKIDIPDKMFEECKVSESSAGVSWWMIMIGAVICVLIGAVIGSFVTLRVIKRKNERAVTHSSPEGQTMLEMTPKPSSTVANGGSTT